MKKTVVTILSAVAITISIAPQFASAEFIQGGLELTSESTTNGVDSLKKSGHLGDVGTTLLISYTAALAAGNTGLTLASMATMIIGGSLLDQKIVAVQVEKDLASLVATKKMTPLLEQLTKNLMDSHKELSLDEAVDAIADYNTEILSSK